MECSNVFKDEIRKFFLEICTDLMTKRQLFGFMTTLDSTYESEKDLINSSKSAIFQRTVDRLLRITYTHIKLFMEMCYQKYKRAVVEPGFILCKNEFYYYHHLSFFFKIYQIP